MSSQMCPHTVFKRDSSFVPSCSTAQIHACCEFHATLYVRIIAWKNSLPDSSSEDADANFSRLSCVPWLYKDVPEKLAPG